MKEYYIDRKKRLAFPIYSSEPAEDEGHCKVTFRFHDPGRHSYVTKIVSISDILKEDCMDVKIYNYEYYQTIKPIRFRFNKQDYIMDRPPSSAPVVIEFNPSFTKWPFFPKTGMVAMNQFSIWTFDVPCMEDAFCKSDFIHKDSDFYASRPKIKVFVNEKRLRGRFEKFDLVDGTMVKLQVCERNPVFKSKKEIFTALMDYGPDFEDKIIFEGIASFLDPVVAEKTVQFKTEIEYHPTEYYKWILSELKFDPDEDDSADQDCSKMWASAKWRLQY